MSGACGCEGGRLCSVVRADADRYLFWAQRDGRSGVLAYLRVAVLSPGLWALLSYRLTHQAATRLRPRRLGSAVAMVLQLLQQVMLVLTNIEIDPRAHIGAGLMFPHSGPIVIGPVRIGANCTISHGVTLGHSATDEDPDRWSTPTLADRVWIGPGAVLAGGLDIGADAAIGANSVVTRDVPPRGVVLGVPARLISRKGSFAQIGYRGMAEDPARAAALVGVDPEPGAAVDAGRQGSL
jgi:serine O-acetyltransferase